MLPKEIDERVRLRFAPSPTGYLHVGGARTALFNYLFAKAHGGTFVLRIEDTDRARSTKEATEQLLASLMWLGCVWDEGPQVEVANAANFDVVLSSSDGSKGNNGPYYQSQRLHNYDEAIAALINSAKAYPCICSAEKLDKDRANAEAVGKPYVYDGKCKKLPKVEQQEILNSGKPHTVRFAVEEKEVVVEDMVKGVVRFDTQLIGDFVIKKSDGFPTYNFAVVVDDAAMKITHVLRGDDHLSNTPRQVMLFRALDKPLPKFAHIAMILGENKQKLSKRDGAVSVLDFAVEGYYPDAMANHLALLGWSPSDGVEVLSRSDLEKAFSSMKFSTAPAVFHREKLDYFNGLYLRSLPPQQFLVDLNAYLLTSAKSKEKVNSESEDVLRNLLSYYGIEPRTKNEWIFEDGQKPSGESQKKFSKAAELLLALRGYCKKLSDIHLLVSNFFSMPEVDEAGKEWVASEAAKDLLKLAKELFSNPATKSEGLPQFISDDEFSSLKKQAKAKLGVSGKPFFMSIRVGITGRIEGLELDVLFKLLKRNDVLSRLAQQ